jgi:GAF domain
VIHIADVLADLDYTWAEAQRLGGYRTVLGVPMLREGIPMGVLTLTRSEVRPFTEKQIELVSTFADQAAIAIENVRLFEEIQDKSRQLAEASERKSQFLASFMSARTVAKFGWQPGRRARPGGRAADERNEIAALHSITSSASASNVGGTSSPSALAVLRLITSSNFVGCSTGRSAGLAPLRIRSTKMADRRNRSWRSGP